MKNAIACDDRVAAHFINGYVNKFVSSRKYLPRRFYVYWVWIYMDLVLRDRHDLFMGDCADSYESAICGFFVGGITLILRVI